MAIIYKVVNWCREKDITGYIKFLEELKTKYKPTKGGQTNETT